MAGGASSLRAGGERASADEARLRLLVVDDSFLVREGLAQLLALSPDVVVTDVVRDPALARAAIAAAPPDVVLTDLRMPPTYTDEGIALAEALRTTNPDIGVIVLSQFAEARYAAALLASGARGRGYLLKDRIEDLGQLVEAITAVAHGECRIDPVLVDRLLDSGQRDPDGALASLTPRQLQILGDVAKGMSNVAISQERYLSLRAVEKYVSEIFIRLGLDHDPLVSRRVRAALIYLDEHRNADER